MRQGLSLPGPAIERPPGTILSELCNVKLGGAPRFDLSLDASAGM
jgi:hypothetical protein